MQIIKIYSFLGDKVMFRELKGEGIERLKK